MPSAVPNAYFHRCLILIDGAADGIAAKTATALLRYRTESVAALLDRSAVGKTAGELLGVGGTIPVVGSIDEALRLDDPPNALVLGIAPAGGRIPLAWKPVLLEAIGRGLSVVSGLHDFLEDDPELVAAAERAGAGVRLIDLRRTDFREVASGQGLREDCLRIHTVGPDCSCGKMVTAVEVARGLCATGHDAQFVATGQTGMLIAGGGIAVDRVIADFVAGAAEQLIRDNQHHDILVIEGQGSLFHPRYSGVTLSLLHGLAPQGLIMLHPMGRKTIGGMPGYPIRPLAEAIAFYEESANYMGPCNVLGVSVNGAGFTDEEVTAECERVERELGLPACDVLRQGSEKLADAVVAAGRTGPT